MNISEQLAPLPSKKRDSSGGENDAPVPKKRKNAPLEPCAICLEEMGKFARLSGCSHVFCYECLKSWSQKDNRCPMCREEFDMIIPVTVKGQNSKRVYRLRKKKPMEMTPPPPPPPTPTPRLPSFRLVPEIIEVDPPVNDPGSTASLLDLLNFMRGTRHIADEDEPMMYDADRFQALIARGEIVMVGEPTTHTFYENLSDEEPSGISYSFATEKHGKLVVLATEDETAVYGRGGRIQLWDPDYRGHINTPKEIVEILRYQRERRWALLPPARWSRTHTFENEPIEV